MKSIKTFVAVAALSLISFGSFAQTITELPNEIRESAATATKVLMDFMVNSLAYFSQGEAFCLDEMNDRRDLARLI